MCKFHICFVPLNTAHKSHNASANCIRWSIDRSLSSMNTCVSTTHGLLSRESLLILEKKSSATMNFFISRRNPRAPSCCTMSSSARCISIVIFEITQAWHASVNIIGLRGRGLARDAPMIGPSRFLTGFVSGSVLWLDRDTSPAFFCAHCCHMVMRFDGKPPFVWRGRRTKGNIV